MGLGANKADPDLDILMYMQDKKKNNDQKVLNILGFEKAQQVDDNKKNVIKTWCNLQLTKTGIY